jgi:tetratricopeptide (TPR) repeat protein
METEGEDVDRGPRVMAFTLAGFAHEFLGETQAAIDFYSQGLQIDPYHDALLIARGMLLYGTSPRAIADFDLAVQNGSRIVWPCFFLAHHYLASGRFEDCAAMCDRGLHLPALTSVRSELTEWIAISQAELRFPPEIVRRTFEQAIRLDPANERARRNLSAFDAEQPGLKRPWAEIRSEAEIRVLGQTDRRYSMAA